MDGRPRPARAATSCEGTGRVGRGLRGHGRGVWTAAMMMAAVMMATVWLAETSTRGREREVGLAWAAYRVHTSAP
jgi:hypothetical protein